MLQARLFVNTLSNVLISKSQYNYIQNGPPCDKVHVYSILRKKAHSVVFSLTRKKY